MSGLLKILKLESGSWDSEENVVNQTINFLKDNRIYNKDSVYRVIASVYHKSILPSLLNEGAYRKASDLDENQFYGCEEENIAHYIDVTCAKHTPFFYIAVFDPEKVNEKLCSIFEYVNSDNKKSAIKALVEVKNDEI